MACQGAGCNQTGCGWNFIQPCKVCILLNNDSTPKRSCWCTLCSHYICKEHFNDAPARIEAALRNAGEVVAEKATTLVNSVKKVFRKRKDKNDGSAATATA